LGALVFLARPESIHGVYGVVSDIRIESDSLARHLASSNSADDVLAHVKMQQTAPAEIDVLVIGCKDAEGDKGSMPSFPPNVLDRLVVCEEKDIPRFIRTFTYLRYLLNNQLNVLVPDIVAAHITFISRLLGPEWRETATDHIISRTRDDFGILTAVLAALSI